MRRKLLLLSLITALFSLTTFEVLAGGKDDPAAKLPFAKKLKWANSLFKQGSFYTAEEYYAQLKKEQPRNPFVTYMLAECAWKTRDYPPAAHYYGEAYSLAPEVYPEAPYKEGLMRKMNGEYEEAIDRLSFYLKNYKGKNKKVKIYVQREIDGCKMAIASLGNPGRAFVKNAGPNVNTAYTELSPLPLGDTALLFATMNSNKILEAKKDKRQDYVSRFMWAPKEFDRTRIKDSFEVALPFEDGKFNDKKYHIGNGSWSPGGSRFYFTKCIESDSLKVQCKIWVAEFNRKKGVWGTPHELDNIINDPEASNTNPYCAMVGKKEVLFFASNRKLQSVGGMDIWYSVYDSSRKVYRRPQNCGKQINTIYDEITPYYDSRKGKLYFSSNGLKNLGGFDVFSANGGPSRYSNIQNLGFPINSSVDDIYYMQDPGEKDNAYVVSNRLGSIFVKNPTCCDDIWRVIKEPNFYVKGVVLDENSNEMIDQVVVKMSDETAVKDTNFSKNGDFMFYTPMGKNYVITADKEGYISGRTTLSTLGKSVIDPDDTTLLTIYMHKISDNSEFRVQNVYYNFNKGEFQPQPESYAALDSLVNFMRDNPAVSVEIRSYTDSKGTDEDNYELSVRRAQAVKGYMIGKGIDAGRMIARGEGEKNPLMPNETNGKDNVVGRQYNRRTEFRIIGELPNMRIIYDQNRPSYIDKSGSDERNSNLNAEPGENDEDGGDTPGELAPGSRIGE